MFNDELNFQRVASILYTTCTHDSCRSGIVSKKTEPTYKTRKLLNLNLSKLLKTMSKFEIVACCQNVVNSQN